MAMIFDTLKLSKTLREGDFSERQADALASALSDQAQDVLASKSDINRLDVKLAELRIELKGEITDVRAEISLLRTDMIKWIVTALAFNFVATAGLFVSFFKLFAK